MSTLRPRTVRYVADADLTMMASIHCAIRGRGSAAGVAMRRATATVFAWALTAAAFAQTPASYAPNGWDAEVKLSEARDTNPGSGDCRDLSHREASRRSKSRPARPSARGPTTAAFPAR